MMLKSLVSDSDLPGPVVTPTRSRRRERAIGQVVCVCGERVREREGGCACIKRQQRESKGKNKNKHNNTYLDGVEEQLGDAGAFNVDEVGLEERLGRTEALATHADHTAIGQLGR